MGFRGGKLAMADIAAVGKLRSYVFLAATRYALARSLRDGLKSLPIWPPTCCVNYFDGKASEPGLPWQGSKALEETCVHSYWRPGEGYADETSPVAPRAARLTSASR